MDIQLLRESATPCCAVILVVCFLYECLALFFFFLPKLQYHSTEKEESTLEESTTQPERITSGRFSSLKHKGEAKLKANFAAIWAATLQNLRAQTKEQTKERQSRVEDIKNTIADGPVRQRGVVRQGVHAHLGITLHEHLIPYFTRGQIDCPLDCACFCLDGGTAMVRLSPNFDNLVERVSRYYC